MFPKKYRLQKEQDIQQVFRGGKRSSGRYIILHASQNKVGKVRMTVVVSKKVSKKAVVRTRIKRQLREIAKKCATAPNDLS